MVNYVTEPGYNILLSWGLGQPFHPSLDLVALRVFAELFRVLLAVQFVA